jgi:hypothetical protein
MIAARTHPVEFVRVVASLMPKELEARLAAIASQGGEDLIAEEDEETLQSVG